MLGSSLNISTRTMPMISIITWLLSHPLTVPALCMAFMVGSVFGAYLQFREDDDLGKNGK
ncbi:Conserved protein [Lacticaseibacillus rhamnosus Lc 705]|nr:Conserved protein [Lacticaseibacillus rhamnosus Lc 705]